MSSIQDLIMLGASDYIVLAFTLTVSSAIGCFYRRQTNANDYLLAGGSMSAGPVAFSLMASFMSAITLLGVTYENYAFGTQFVAINLAYIIGTPIAAYVYLPVFFRAVSLAAAFLLLISYLKLADYSSTLRVFTEKNNLLYRLILLLNYIAELGECLCLPGKEVRPPDQDHSLVGL